MKSLFYISLLILLSGVVFAQNRERWPVKVLTDGFTVSGTPKKTTVAELQKIPLTKVGNKTPRLPFEKKLIQVTGTITRKTPEADGDYHIEIQDISSDSTLPCEAVNPNDARKSPYLEKFRAVRSALSKLHIGDIVTIIGVEFQDKFHKPSKLRLRNFIEIHPILSIK